MTCKSRLGGNGVVWLLDGAVVCPPLPPCAGTAANRRGHSAGELTIWQAVWELAKRADISLGDGAKRDTTS